MDTIVILFCFAAISLAVNAGYIAVNGAYREGQRVYFGLAILLINIFLLCFDPLSVTGPLQLLGVILRSFILWGLISGIIDAISRGPKVSSNRRYVP